MNISLIAVDRINNLVTVASHNISEAEDEYRATFKITFDGENMLVNLDGQVYHSEVEINKAEIPIRIVQEMIGFIRYFFKKPSANQSPPTQFLFDF